MFRDSVLCLENNNLSSISSTILRAHSHKSYAFEKRTHTIACPIKSMKYLVFVEIAFPGLPTVIPLVSNKNQSQIEFGHQNANQCLPLHSRSVKLGPEMDEECQRDIVGLYWFYCRNWKPVTAHEFEMKCNGDHFTFERSKDSRVVVKK